MSPESEVISFFRNYKVRIPFGMKHRREFVLEQIEHVERLKSFTPNIQINVALDDVRKKWETIARQNDWLAAPVIPPKPKIWRLNFKSFVSDNKISDPNVDFAVDADHAAELLEDINRGLALLDSEDFKKFAPDSVSFARRRLLSWRKGFLFQRKRASETFGLENKAAKGPPAHKLQKQAANRQRDQELRNRMKNRRG